MDLTSEVMINLIKNQICGTKIDDKLLIPVSEELAEKLYILSESHSLAHIVGLALENNHLLLPGTQTELKFKQQIYLILQQQTSMEYELNSISELFKSEAIPFLPLKGAVIRYYYNEPWLRNSCDIDILIHKSDLEKTKRVLIDKMNYSTETTEGIHDVSLYSGAVHLELHFDLVEEGRANEAKKILDLVWNNSKKAGNSTQYEMNDEILYYYHMAHMAKHIEIGGCGVRNFIDVWVLNHNITFDRSKREKILEKGNLLKFALAAEKLSEVWFSGAAPNNDDLLFQDFILRSGIYGNMNNTIAVSAVKSKSKTAFIRKSMFPPFSTMIVLYPWIKSRKWLLPIGWIVRLFKSVFKKEACIIFKNGVKASLLPNNNQYQATQKILYNLGLLNSSVK